MIRVDIQEIHQSVIFDTDEPGDAAIHIGDKDSSGAKAGRPAIHVRRLGSPCRDLFVRVVSCTDLAHGASKAAHNPLKVTVYVCADHESSPDTISTLWPSRSSMYAA
jgi:hypothetical protein